MNISDILVNQNCSNCKYGNTYEDHGYCCKFHKTLYLSDNGYWVIDFYYIEPKYKDIFDENCNYVETIDLNDEKREILGKISHSNYFVICKEQLPTIKAMLKVIEKESKKEFDLPIDFYLHTNSELILK